MYKGVAVREVAFDGAAATGAATMRLDPWRLPHRVSFEDGKGGSFTLDRQGAVVKRRLPASGLNVSLALPARAFRGVAAKAIEHEDGSYTVRLELSHRDPALSVPLLVSHDLDDIAADWHAWSRLMRLPMLIVEADDIARPVREMLGQIMVDAPFTRRKLFSILKRRPRFLARRKPGKVGPVEKITGEELIARR